MPTVPSPQPGLPEPVEAMRRSVVAAAVACDYQQLEELASRGAARFTFSFGGGDDAAAHWRAGEAAGDEPLRYLAGLLTVPHAAAEPDQFVWPSAFAYEKWSEVPEPDRAVLRGLYTAEELEGFARFGSYAGYRAGIAADGEWLFFVAGD
ncbi:MAG TPA: hypothetical protein VF230_13660 [Acidimicrobiales bacterium]